MKNLKKLSINYISLTNDFTKKSYLFDFISVSHKINLDYEMKMITEFDFDAVINLCTKMSKFYNDIELKVKEIEGLINESIDTKG